MVTISGLTKYYSTGHCALDNVSFCVEDGQICGLLGPNGAGKSTIMNIMTGYVSPTFGKVLIDGADILESPAEVKAKIAYLPEIPPLYVDMTPNEYLRFVGQLRSIPKARLKEQIAYALERTSLTDVQNRLIKTLSKGYRQRVGLASALIGDPSLIILDEPTVGLDPSQVIEVRTLIEDLGRDHTIILSSHILSEVQAVCSKVIIIDHGKLIAQGSPEELSAQLRAGKTLRITARGTGEKISAVAAAIPGVTHCTIQQESDGVTTAALSLDSGEDLRASISEAMVFAGIPIIEMQLQTDNLEDIFLQLTDHENEQAKG